MENRKKKKIINYIFWAYFGFMFLGLFVRHVNIPAAGSSEYWELVKTRKNLIPFHTVSGYWKSLITLSPANGIWKVAFANVFGNIFLFAPIGFFMPYYFKPANKIWIFFPLTTVLICLVELIQLFTLQGFCDIDDLILNVFGATLGWIVYWIGRKACSRSQKKNKDK